MVDNKDSTRTSDDTGDSLSPERLRISHDYAAGSVVKKALITVPVRRPDRQWFVRVRPGEEWRLATRVIEIKEDRGIYLVDPDVAATIAAEIIPMMLFTSINRQGLPFL